MRRTTPTWLLFPLAGALASCNCGGRVVGFPAPGGPCATTADCGPGQTCVLGMCRAPCPCEASDECVDGFCFPRNCADRQCAAGEVCLGDRCGDPHCGGRSLADFEGDVSNCGACGQVCQAANATPLCVHGVCTRSPCLTGYFDFDPAVPGCETRCDPSGCFDLADRPVRIDSVPLPETGLVREARSSGTSRGALLQASAQYTAVTVTGDVSASFVDQNANELKSNAYILRGGFVPGAP